MKLSHDAADCFMKLRGGHDVSGRPEQNGSKCVINRAAANDAVICKPQESEK